MERVIRTQGRAAKRAHKNSRLFTMPSIDDKGLPLGTLATIVAVLAPFLGYLLAYGWRSGEAQFYGITPDLITVSLEDGLRFAVPLALALFCVAVITAIDSKEQAIKKLSTKWGLVRVFLILACTLAGVYGMRFFSEKQNEILSTVFLIATIVFCLAFVLASFRLIFSICWSAVAVSAIFCSFAAASSLDWPFAYAASLFVNVAVLLIYLGRFQKGSSKNDRSKKLEGCHIMIYAAVGALFVALAYGTSVCVGHGAAGANERIVLLSGEVVLATYGGDRSVVGTLEKERIEKYRVANLSDEGCWEIKEAKLEGCSLLPF